MNKKFPREKIASSKKWCENEEKKYVYKLMNRINLCLSKVIFSMQGLMPDDRATKIWIKDSKPICYYAEFSSSIVALRFKKNLNGFLRIGFGGNCTIPKNGRFMLEHEYWSAFDKKRGR